MPSRYALYVLGLMVGINLLNYMDRWVGSAVAPLIQLEFDLSDFSVGLLGSAFTLVYALAALPFGLWADRGSCRIVLGAGVLVWSLATLLTGLTRNFAQLFATRAVLGIGEASYFPAGTSLLGDLFPRHLRGRVMSIWSAGSAFGIALGFAGGGLLAASHTTANRNAGTNTSAEAARAMVTNTAAPTNPAIDTSRSARAERRRRQSATPHQRHGPPVVEPRAGAARALIFGRRRSWRVSRPSAR